MVKQGRYDRLNVIETTKMWVLIEINRRELKLILGVFYIKPSN